MGNFFRRNFMGSGALICAAGICLLGSCAKQDAGTDPSDPSASSVVDIKRIVSTGASLSFNNQTGGVNDLALQSSGLPAIAYYDKSAAVSATTAVGALKYAYLGENGAWSVEVVDANFGTAVCGTAGGNCLGAPNVAAGNTASILKLAFTSTGLPAIAYVYGNSAAGAGTKQVRLAERDTSGNWKISVAYASNTTAGVTNVATVATVDPIKGLGLVFDASNRPHVSFTIYTQTATNSTIKYAFRATTGDWTVTDVASAVTGVGTIAAVGQGNNQSALVFCPANSMPVLTGLVVDAVGGVGRPLYSRCTALASNGGCSTWSTVNLATGCSGACFSAGILAANSAGQRTDLTINPANHHPVFTAYNTTTTSLVEAELPNACDVDQPSAAGGWGVATVVAAGSAGLHGFRSAVSSTQRFLAYLTSTTNVMLNVNTSGAWLATGNLVETVTVGAEGVGAGFDTTNGVLYASYAAIPGGLVGATGNDIKVAVSTPSELVSAGAAGTVPWEVVDTLVTAFPSTAVPMLSAARASDGTVGFAYFYQDNAVADSKLYYGLRGGDTLSPVFSTNFVTNHIEGAASPAFAGSYPSLAHDSTDNPVIGFYNGVAADQQLIVARSRNRGVSFSLSVVDDSSANVGQYPSVAASGTSLAVAYYDVTNTGLKFARFTPATGWRRFSVDGLAGTGSCGNVADDAGKYAKLAVTSDGYPVIAYQSNTNLKLAYAATALSGTSFTWTCLVLDGAASTRGEGIDLVLDSSQAPHIAHFDSTAGTVRYVNCTSAIGTCVTTGTGAFTGSSVAGTGTLSSIITRPNVQVTSDGTVYLSYYSASFQGLALAYRAATATAWTIEYVDQAESGASFISAAGQYGVLLLNASSLPMLFYRSTENWLKYFSRELSN